MKPKALDLFCGAGGATKGLQMAGFHVTGVDISPHSEYPGDCFRMADALRYPLEGFDFIWASTPCQEFSVHDMQMFFKNPPHPIEGLRLFNGTRLRLEASGIPFVMENVRAATRFVGPSVQHCGPFHLWGNCVPAIFPQHLYQLRKGLDFGWVIDGATKKRILGGGRRYSSKSAARREYSRTIAMIPLELGEFIGKQALEYMRRAA